MGKRRPIFCKEEVDSTINVLIFHFNVPFISYYRLLQVPCHYYWTKMKHKTTIMKDTHIGDMKVIIYIIDNCI
jgi:hypothetical protein